MTIREAFGKLALATAKAMKNPFFVIRNLHKEFKDIQDNVTSCGLVQDAKDIDYDNTSSGLTAEDAQAAIDELAGAIDDAETEISTIDGRVDHLEGGDNINIIHSAASNQTYEAQLTELKPYFFALTAEQKNRAILIDNDTVYHIVNTDIGFFTINYVYGSDIYMNSMQLGLGHEYRTSVNGVVTDSSASTNTHDLTLAII